MGEVFLFGGSPMVGKTTMALETAASKKIACISTDDIIRIIEDVSGYEGSSGRNYLEYYEKTPIEKLIEDTVLSHKRAEDVIKKFIIRHSTWGDPFVLEGWAIYPHLLNEVEPKNIKATFLVGTEKLFWSRIVHNRYYAKASENVKSKYIMRSLWHNNLIMSECKTYGYKYIMIDGQ